jgi:hypothetical protein
MRFLLSSYPSLFHLFHLTDQFTDGFTDRVTYGFTDRVTDSLPNCVTADGFSYTFSDQDPYGAGCFPVELWAVHRHRVVGCCARPFKMPCGSNCGRLGERRQLWFV